MAVYPSNMAPIGVKLWENAFQMIPDISFSMGKSNFGKIFVTNFRRKIGKHFRQKLFHDARKS